MLHIHITCLHIYIVYIYLHLLPRTPDCVMAEARITEFFGETQTDGRSVRIREEVLDFMGLGSCMPREAWRLPSPQPLHNVMVSRQALSLAVGSALACAWRGCFLQLPPRRSRWQSPTRRVCEALRTGIPYTRPQSVGFDHYYASGSKHMSRSRKMFFSWHLSIQFSTVWRPPRRVRPLRGLRGG